MISEIEAQELLAGRDLIAIGMRGDEIRRQMHGPRTTFVRVFEIHVDALVSSLPSKTSAGEFRIVGSPASFDAAAAAVRSARALAGDVPVTGFSLSDLIALAGPSSLADICRDLRSAGLDGIAEAPLDALADPEAAIAAARETGPGVVRLTVNSVSSNDRAAVAHVARRVQESVGGIRAFAPLPRVIAVATPTTGYDDVKQVAVARLIADNIDSIQVDWKLYGPKLAQFALTVGADDVDNVAAVDPGTLGTRRSPLEEIRGNIRSAGLEPVERNGRFEAVV